MQEIFSSNPPVVIRICDSNNYWAWHHHRSNICAACFEVSIGVAVKHVQSIGIIKGFLSVPTLTLWYAMDMPLAFVVKTYYFPKQTVLQKSLNAAVRYCRCCRLPMLGRFDKSVPLNMSHRVLNMPL